MMEYKDNISRARAQLEQAQTNLIEAYFTRIKEGYKILEPRQKEFVLDGLDALVTSIERGYFIDEFDISSEIHSTKKESSYNYKIARQIREKVRLTRAELVEELGLRKGTATQIANYELGKVKPRNPPIGKTPVAYMNWLKEHGYNPFDL